MGRREKAWLKPVFRRLVVSFVCILLPIYILSIVVYNWGINTIRESISISAKNQTSFYMDEIEAEIQRILFHQYDFFNDKNLMRLSSIPESLNDMERTAALLSLNQRIFTVKNSSEYIEEVAVHIPALNRTITCLGPGLFDHTEYLNIIGHKEKDSVAVVDIRGIYLHAVSSIPYIDRDKEIIARYAVSIKLSEEKVAEVLKSLEHVGNEIIIFYSQVNNLRIAINDTQTFDWNIEETFMQIDFLPKTGSDTIRVDGTGYLAIYSYSDFIDSAVFVYVPENTIFQPLRRFRAWFILLTVVAFIIIVGYSYYLHKFINQPLSVLVKSFKKMEDGDLDNRIGNQNDNEFGYIYRHFNAMLDKLNLLIDQVYKQKILMQKLEMKQLQSQINPHFLYNSFFALRTMVQSKDYGSLELFTDQLGRYFCFLTRNSKDQIELCKEVEHARVYANIQTKRFSRRIRTKFNELPEKFSGISVPRLIIQPIIENAFEHGLASKKKDGLLRVEFNEIFDGLEIIVEDNGDELTDEILENLNYLIYSDSTDYEVTGLPNIYRRLKLMFGPNCSMSFGRGDLGGLKVIISIKIRPGGQNV